MKLFILLTILTTFTYCENETWKVILETDRRPFADSPTTIYMQLIGDFKESELIYLNPPSRREYGSILKYPFQFNNDIGSLRQLVIGLQRNKIFLGDHYFYRVELIDTFNKSYVFTCNCLLSRARPKILLSLNGQRYPDYDPIHYHGSRYPVTLGLLSMLTFFIMFTYVINFIRKKWRNRMRFDEMRMRFRRNLQENTGGLGGGGLTHETVTLEINREKMDLPPKYKDLFPDADSQQPQQQQLVTNTTK